MQNSSRLALREENRLRHSPQQLEVPFVDQCPEDLQCQICLGPAVEPVVTEECGHLFCRDCIHLAMERKKECPVDRLPLTPTELRKDIRSQRKILGLSTFCFNKKQGCPWKGVFSDLERHAEKCDWATVRCPFGTHGCDAVVTRKTLQDHIQTSLAAHLTLACTALTRLTEESIAMQHELELLQRDDRFIWVVANFESKRGPLYSRKFSAKGYFWYLGIDFEGPEQHAGVYLFADGHNRRVDFKLFLFNQDPTKDKVHLVNDWAPDYKGKGWGPLKFIDRSTNAQSGYIVNGCIRIGAEVDGEPFD